MPTTLSVPVSDAALARLQSQAVAQGTTLEAIAAAELERADPAPLPGFFGKWAGAIHTDVPDIAARHDEYIGQGLHEAMSHDRPS